MIKEREIPKEIKDYKNELIEKLNKTTGEKFPNLTKAINNYCLNLGSDSDNFYKENYLCITTDQVVGILDAFGVENKETCINKGKTSINGFRISKLDENTLVFMFDEHGVNELNTSGLLKQKKYEVFSGLEFPRLHRLITREAYEEKIKTEKLKNYKNPFVQEVVSKYPEIADDLNYYFLKMGNSEEFYKDNYLMIKADANQADDILRAFGVEKKNTIVSGVAKQKTNVDGLLVSKSAESIIFILDLEENAYGKLNTPQLLEQKNQGMFTMRFDYPCDTMSKKRYDNMEKSEIGRVVNIAILQDRIKHLGEDGRPLIEQISAKVRKSTDNDRYNEYKELFKNDPLIVLISKLKELGCVDSFQNSIAKLRKEIFIDYIGKGLLASDESVDSLANIYGEINKNTKSGQLEHKVSIKADNTHNVNVGLLKDIEKKKEIEKAYTQINRHLLKSYDIKANVAGINIASEYDRSKKTQSNIKLEMGPKELANVSKAVLHELFLGIDIANVNKILLLEVK